MKIGCVVMASGDSSRFGGNKLLAPFLGRPLILHTLEKLPRTLTKSLVVTRDAAVAALARDAGFECLLHAEPDVSDTIRLGVSAMRDMDGCLFCVADQPLCATETMERMAECFRAHPDAIVRVCHDGQDGNPVLFARAFYDSLLSLSPGQTGGTVIRKHTEAVLRVEAASAWELFDVDTPDALAALEAHAAKGTNIV